MTPTISWIDFSGTMPLLILAVTGMVVLMWDAFEKHPSRIPLTLTILGAIGAIVAAGFNLSHSATAFNNMILDNGYSAYYSIVFSVAVIISVLLAERYLKDEEVVIGEFSGLVLFSACGMIMLASGNDLIVTFLGLETMSIAFYVLSGLFRKRQASNEAALKYFLLGAFSAGFFLYGIALLYGSFGTTNLSVIQHFLISSPKSAEVIASSPIFWMGASLMIVGFAFKIAAFPFHQWAPDVYEGAPTVVTGFMSTAGKAGAFSALVLIFNIALQPLMAIPAAAEKLQMIFGLLGVGSMLYGNITALSQTHVKRMLAYSSIAHAGYMLMGVAAMTTEGANAVTIYLTVYLFMQMGAFGVVGFLEKQNGGGLLLSDYVGLGRRRPWLAFVMAVMMISLAGIPPFGGFFGKYYLFTAAIRSGLTWLAVVGAISTLISIYFYLRIIVLMYFREDESGEISSAQLVTSPDGTVAMVGDGAAWAALVLSAVGILILGVLPMVLTNASKMFFAK